MLTAALAAVLLLLLLAPIGATAGRAPATARILVYGGAAIATGANLAIALKFLLGGQDAPLLQVLPIGLPFLPAHFRLDALSAYFLVVVNLVGLMAAVFGLGYGRHEHEPERVLPFFPLFLAGMNLVPLADDAFAFLVAWEFMSLSSWLLVLSTHHEADTPRAAQVYLVMAAMGTAALVLAFGAMAGVAGDYSFDAIRAREFTPGIAALVLFLLMLGAGSKAGIVPLHAWLPLAHPAAPSHVSALMSGAMTKIAIYALLRVLFDLMTQSAWWWGAVVILLGGATALLGVLYALMQEDLKRLLAYSTIEHVGVIVIGIGLALAFRVDGPAALAALGLTAALLHVLNHAVFKSLLFFGTGAVLVATGERDMGRLGGLIHRMPATAFAILVGCAAISALPPLNGFVSEWLTFQAILNGPLLPQWLLKFVVPVVGVLLALSAALAAACFVKAFGISFLGRPRSDAATKAREVEITMLAPMLLLALACLVLGALPTLALRLVQPAVAKLTGAPPVAGDSWLWLTPVADRGGSYSGLVVLATILLATFALVAGVRRLAVLKLRRVPPWDCGFPDPRPETQYTGSSFSQPLRRLFGSTAFRAVEHVDMPAPGDVRAAHFSVSMRDLAWEWFYAPIVAVLQWLTERMNALQFLTIRRYLSLMFAALVLLLALVVVSQ